MKTTRLISFGRGLAPVIAMLFIVGCSSKNDAVSNAEKKENGRPSIGETKAIAQEGFIYGLPIVMYYTSAYELFVDTTSSQYKAPIGTLFNEARVFTPKTRRSLRPTAIRRIP